jgi:thiol-disulfide isomerase/thioredoxin
MRIFGAFAVVAVLAIVVTVIVGFGGSPRHFLAWLTRGSPVQVGQQLPRLTYETLDGSPVVLALAPGHVTFVNVFATWCPPCKSETPDLVSFAASESGKGVDVVGIDQEESARAVQLFRQQYHVGYPVVIDTGRASKDVLGARIIPETIVVGANGVIRNIVSGPMTRPQMERLAAGAAGGS